MTELDWRRLENRLVDAHRAADPPLSPAIWRGVEATRAAPAPRRAVWLAMAVAVLVAAGVVLWFLPAAPVPADATVRVVAIVERAIDAVRRAAPPPGPAIPAVAPAVPAERSPAPILNQVLETRGPVTFAIAVDAGRIELEPCRGRFVNVTLLDGPHRSLALRERDRRVEVTFDGGDAMRGGVAHILVPADTHLVVSARGGSVVVRGLGGAMEIDSTSGEVQLDTAPRLDPVVRVTSDSGAITWSGRCGRGCRVEARSRTGDITLRAPDRAAFTRGAARGESQAGRVHLEELTCLDPRCSSSPLPWRQPAGAPHP